MSGMRFPPDSLRRPLSDLKPALPLLSGQWIVAGITATILIDVLLLASARLRIGLSWASIGFATWGVAAMAIAYVFRAPVTRAQRIVRDVNEGVSLFAAISLLGAIASYPLAKEAHGFVDPALERIDLSLHFHWLNWYEIVANHARIQSFERIAYLSIYLTPILILGQFAWSEQRAESRLFIATFWVAALITLALFPLLPAIGPLATLWHGNMPYMPLSALYQDQVILALRHQIIHSVDLGALRGLVCVPSFHAVCAVLYIATAWRVPLLRWPVAILNVAMLLATLVEGTHYLADLLFGMIVALFALGLTPVLIRLTNSRSATQRGMHQTAVPVPGE